MTKHIKSNFKIKKKTMSKRIKNLKLNPFNSLEQFLMIRYQCFFFNIL